MPSLRGPDEALSFLRDRGIKWWKSIGSGDSDTDGPTRNLASSQVACVNFLLPLARIPGALRAALRAIDPDVEDVLPIVDHAGRSSPVEIEWVGWSDPLEGGRITRGANQTSADALLVARTPTGNRAYVFEWKYCEEDLHPEDKGAGRSGDTRRSRYLERYHAPTSSFAGDVPLNEFLFEPFYQLMRLRLLADRMVSEGVTPSLRVVDARVVVVCPAENQEYRTVVTSTPLARRFAGHVALEDVMRATLKNPRGIELVAPERLVAALGASPLDGSLLPWLDYHRQRYGWGVEVGNGGR
jgi:hypothetical protein